MAMSPEIVGKIKDAGVIAVLVIDDKNQAIPVAHALLEGGIHIIELALRTPASFDAVYEIKKHVPQMIIGLGTLIRREQVQQGIDAGADFAVAPGCNPKIISEAHKRKLSFAPGVMTPTDIEIAIDFGCSVMKFFPAESSGGIKHLESIANPYQMMNLKFIPLGGCNPDNATTYLQSKHVIAIGGSWIATRALIHDKNWEGVTRNARHINEIITSINLP